MPRPAPNPRRYIALVARQRRPADAVRGVADRVQDGEVSARSWSAPCRWAGGGSVPDPAKDVAEDVRDAPRGQPLEPARDRGVVRLRSGGRSSHAPVLQRKRGAAHHRSGPAILGRRHRFPVRYDSSDRRKDRLPQEFKHGRPPGLHPHRVRTRGSEMAMILPVGHPSRPADRATDGAGWQITRDPLGRAAPPWPRRSSCSRVITSPVASALLALGPNGICLRIADYTADHDRPTTRDRRRLRVTRQGRGRDAAAVQVAVLGGSICDSEPSGPRDAP